jgi:hypothetical protein
MEPRGWQIAFEGIENFFLFNTALSVKEHRIKFQMRLRKNTLVRNGRGQYAHAWRLFCRTRITSSGHS